MKRGTNIDITGGGLKPIKISILLILFICVFNEYCRAQSASKLFLIDFESFTEGTQISNQYAHLGAEFSLADDPNEFPIIAVEGSPTAAFKKGSVSDKPMSSGAGGLTDPLVDNEFNIGRDIAIEFNPHVTSVRLFIIDLDSSDTVTLRAYNGDVEVDSDTHSAGQTGTGDGVSTEFFVSAETITRVVVDVPAVIGYAVDFITFTRPCSGSECGPTIEIAQESIPDANDFDDNVLGFILAYPSSSTAANFYAYDVPEGASWNGPSLTPIADRSHLLLAETTDGLTLVIVHDRAIPNDADGGRAEMKFELHNDPDGAFRTAEDDPHSEEAGAGYTGVPGDSVFTSAHFWSPCCTDGWALSGLEGPWSMYVQFTEVDDNPGTAPVAGMDEWVAYSAEGNEITLALELDRRVRLRLVDTSLPGDFNGDGKVNLIDVALFSIQWQQKNCTGPGWCNLADINQDGEVNKADLFILNSNWL